MENYQRAEIGVWPASSPPASIGFSAGGAQKITRCPHECHYNDFIFFHLHINRKITITIPRRSRGVHITSLWGFHLYINQKITMTIPRKLRGVAIMSLWGFHLYSHFSLLFFRPLLSFMAHERIFKIIFIFFCSFRAKTVYKVVTVVQPPFMMWNATTGAP